MEMGELESVATSSDGQQNLSATSQEQFNRLIEHLRNSNEDEFLEEINSVDDRDQLKKFFSKVDNSDTLLILAVKNGLLTAVEKLLELGADVNASNQAKHPLTPLKAACIFGKSDVLKTLLQRPELDSENAGSFVSIVVKNYDYKHTDHKGCLDELLKHKGIDINESDAIGFSALHYALSRNNEDAVLKLLESGAVIEVKNKYHKIALSDANPKILEKHFNSCITTDGNYFDDNFEIHFDYKNLIPISRKGESEGSNVEESHANCPDEMATIESIAESKELRQLVCHPLITSFLFLKWNRLAYIFYINFILCSLFAVCYIAYILTYYTNVIASNSVQCKNATSPNYADPETHPMASSFLRVATIILTVCISLRELFQLAFAPRTYLKSVENYLELLLITFVVMILILFNPNPTCERLLSNDWVRTIAAISILLVAFEIFHLAGSLPCWSCPIHYVMLRTVTKTFLRSLLLYAIILIAFALTFLALLYDPSPADDGDDETFKFSNVKSSLFKTLVMSIGEFDAGSIGFDRNPSSYIFFVVFMFIVATVLFNLLNGLAVSDTQVIKSEAELIHNIRRCQVLARYERALLSGNSWIGFPIIQKYFSRSSISVANQLKADKILTVKPNLNNQIVFAQDNGINCIRCCHGIDPCCRMDGRIVKLASSVLEKIKMEKYEQNERDQIKTLIKNVEKLLAAKRFLP
ncbi:transient receptor potential cation channel protein painless-like [Bradysia coprophila]|uniref:transient receptor potential cation channel protein painless-like n=1 Tax=Bradysia coprophila TaxID=38358 RepID=UPI00187DC784|nr:transient receptor potential cation channel protein painless-like [Bradysia coprophila]